MKKLLSHIFTPIFFLAFAVILLIFHPIQVICKNIWGYEMHKRSVSILNLFIFKSLKIMGANIKVNGSFDLPTDRPLIIVSNHQSTYDIPAILWLFRKNHPKFISKKSLGKHIPSISYNLRHSGSALIDRKNASQSIKEIIRLGKFIQENNFSACIFPEGTRTRTGQMRNFQSGGIKTLLKVAPDSLIVPFAISGNYKLHRYGKYPLSYGEQLTFTVLDPIEPKNYSPEEIVENIKQEIIKTIS